MQTKLAAQRELRTTMGDLETMRQKWLAEGADVADTDREIAGAELAQILNFCMDCGIRAEALHSLLRELVTLIAGATPSRMILPAKTSHRRPDSPIIENIKGRLAAIMEHRQRAGVTRKDASAWVIRNTALEMQQVLGARSPGAVSAWLQKWGGKIGATPGSGRDGYLAMRDLLKNENPTERQMSEIIGSSLFKYLPCEQSK